MARVGIEPTTPRFSGARRIAPFAGITPAEPVFIPMLWRPGVAAGFGWIPGGSGLDAALESN